MMTETTPPQLFHGDLPADIAAKIIATGSVAIDTETTGLSLVRDRLCLVQMATANGDTYFVKFNAGEKISAPNLAKLLADTSVLKLYHFGRFDIAQLKIHTGALSANNYCTKIAARIGRTYSDRSGLKDLVRDYLSVEISKQQQTSDWGAETLSDEQLTYAAGDVIYLHGLKEKLDAVIAREGRAHLLQPCLDFLPTRCLLDIEGWEDIDMFSHSLPRK